MPLVTVMQLARSTWISRPAAISQLKKEVAQLQLDAQAERAMSDADLQFQQQETAQAYIGLQQACLWL